MNEPTNWIAAVPKTGACPEAMIPSRTVIQHDRRRVVQEGLAFDQPGQPAGRPDIAKQRDDRGGIGRRDHRAEQQANDQRQAGERP